MNIEVVEFYPHEINDEKESLSGTLRIKLVDSAIHILGIFVSKRKNYWHFNLPGRTGVNHLTGEHVRYPYIVFEDREQHRALIAAIKEQGPTFIERRLADFERTIVFSKKQQQDLKQAESPKAREKATAPKETAFSTSPKPSVKKIWQDPPPRKIPAINTTFRKNALKRG